MGRVINKADILIVEPDHVLSKNYALALHEAGFKVRMAVDAQTAIHAADRRKPDLILLEVKLAAHSGIEFLYELRSYPEWQNIPVIILTSVPEKELSVGNSSWQKLGRVKYLNKSTTTLAELAKVVDRNLAKTVK